MKQEELYIATNSEKIKSLFDATYSRSNIDELLKESITFIYNKESNSFSPVYEQDRNQKINNFKYIIKSTTITYTD